MFQGFRSKINYNIRFINSIIDIEEISSCHYDYVAIDDQHYCGSIEPGYVMDTDKNSVNFVFETDQSVAHDGFQLKFSCV